MAYPMGVRFSQDPLKSVSGGGDCGGGNSKRHASNLGHIEESKDSKR